MSGTQVTPSDSPKCPQCGTPLPTGALAGLCPACLLKQGAADETATGGQSPPFQPPPIAELVPLFPQLEILEFIGKGGMGAVYKARQKELDRIVALKILPPGIGQDAAFAGRFAREARALAKLNHPGIVTLYEFGTASASQPSSLNSQPLYYFLMEFVDGVNLRQLLHAGRIAPREALAIVPQICDALQYAHDQGIVHRDIKPENILLDRRGRVKVADFGLAKLVQMDGRAELPLGPDAQQRVPTDDALTAAVKVMGTPNYMAPEQKEHPDAVDHRADIYALGVVFYQMLTGELPGQCIAPPSSKVQIDVRLDEVVLRALETKPERRYQQVSEVKTCVETIVGNSGGAPGSTTSQAAINEAEWNNPRNWTGPKWLSIYFSKRDSRAWAPKQIPGFGWTVNLGNPRGAFALLAIVGAIIIALVVVPLAIFKPGHANSIKSDYIGEASFPKGDSIEIISVERSTNRMVVKGHYNLVSHEQATLALYITSTNQNVPEDATQRMQIAKGRGDFKLIHSHLVPGLPHVSMYADGGSFAAVYFGTQVEALEESKLPQGNSLATSDAPPLAWTNWNNGQSIGSFYAVAGTATETVAVGIDGRIATRNNGTGVWTIQTFTGDPDFRAIVYANGQYVVVREQGSIMTSPDGITWTGRTSPTTNNLLGLFWDGHQYLAGGDHGTILASPDAITWVNRVSGSDVNFYSISYSGSRYVAVGNDGICISTDTVTWTTPTTRWATARIPFTACTWTGTEFLTCGLGLDKFPTIYTCPDGDSWMPRDATVTDSLRAAITINGEIYIAGDSVIKKSADGGTTWRDIYTNTTSNNNLFMGLAFNGQALIAVGFNHNVWATPILPAPHAGKAKKLDATDAAMDPTLPTSAFQIRLVAEDSETDVPTDTLTNFLDQSHFEQLRLMRAVLLDGKAVENAGWKTDGIDGQTNFMIGLTETGSRQFEILTAANLKRRIAIVFQGRILLAPVIQGPISSGRIELPVAWDKEDLERTVNGLNWMKTPVTDLRFGPEQKSILPPLQGPEWSFLNLRANRLVTNSHAEPGTRALNDWQRDNGADLAALISDKSPHLRGYGIVITTVGTNGWDTSTPADIWYNWNLMVNEPKSEVALAEVPGKASGIYYFRTRDDSWGILQIIGFTKEPGSNFMENPSSVRVRYKLVQNGSKQLGGVLASKAFTAQFSQGQISLLGVSQLASSNSTWWRPDGSISSQSFEAEWNHSPASDSIARLVFETQGFPNHSAFIYRVAPAACSTIGQSSEVRSSGKQLPGCNMLFVKIPKPAATNALKQFNVQIGVASGPGTVISKCGTQGGSSEDTSLPDGTRFHLMSIAPVEGKDSIFLSYSYNSLPGWNVNITAMDNDGKIREAVTSDSSLNELSQTEARFEGLKLSDIKEFRFAVRRYEWMEFRNISLLPGQPTPFEIAESGLK